MKVKSLSFVAAVSAASHVFFPLSARSENLYWGTGGGGAWVTPSNWYTDAAGVTVSGTAPLSTTDVFFNTTPTNSAGGSVTMSSNIAAHSLTFNTSAATTLTQSGNRTLTLGGGGITLNSGAGNATLGVSTNSLSVQLLESQSWVNNSTSTLNVRTFRASDSATGPVTLTLNAASGAILFNLAASDSPDSSYYLGLIIDTAGTAAASTVGSTYSGGTTIKQGVLNSNGNIGSGSVLLGDTSGSANARLHLTGVAINNITVQAGSSGAAYLSGSGSGDFQGDILLNKDVAIGNVGSATTLAVSGDISGVGGLTFARLPGASGNPTVTLTGANTYTGKTTIDSATVVVNSLNRVSGGAASSSLGAPVTVENGTIKMSAVTASTLRYTGTGETTDRVIEIASNVGATLDHSGSGPLIFTSTLVNTGLGSRTLTLTGTAAGTGEFAGAINNIATGTNVGVTKSGSGTWRLSGTANTYANTTSIAGGVLEVTKLADTGVASSIGTGSVASITFSGGTLRYLGSGDSSNRSFTVGAAGATFDASGSGSLVLSRTAAPAYGTGNVPTSITLTGTNTDANTYAANQNNNGSGAVSITKEGGGKWALTGSSSYTGVTTVNAGTLLINGRLTASAVSLNAAILGGSGTANALVTTAGVASTISPGNSPGTLTLAGGLDATAGATFVFELGTTSDVLSLGGGVLTGSTAAGGMVFNFSDSGGLLAGNPYTIMTFGSSSGLDYTDFMASILPSGYVLDTSFGTGGFQINGTDLQVQFDVVPEPGTVALLAGGLMTVFFFRRRRS